MRAQVGSEDARPLGLCDRSAAGSDRLDTLARLRVGFAGPCGIRRLETGVLFWPLFANRRYNSYFYSVQVQYATPSRPEYQASGGYAGTEFLHRAVETLPQILGGRLHALRQPVRCRIRGQSAGPARSLLDRGFRHSVASANLLAAYRRSRLMPLEQTLSPRTMPRLLKTAYEYFALYTSLTLLGLICLAGRCSRFRCTTSCPASSERRSAGAASCAAFASTPRRFRSPAATAWTLGDRRPARRAADDPRAQPSLAHRRAAHPHSAPERRLRDEGRAR